MENRRTRDTLRPHTTDSRTLNRLAVQATTHCLTGCAIGDVLGLVVSNAIGLATIPSIAVAILLAYVFGFGLTMRPLLAGGMALAAAARLAFAADTLTITVMEIVDQTRFVLVVPGSMTAGLDDPLFWGSLELSLAIAWLAAFPVARWLIARGRGHAVLDGPPLRG